MLAKPIPDQKTWRWGETAFWLSSENRPDFTWLLGHFCEHPYKLNDPCTRFLVRFGGIASERLVFYSLLRLLRSLTHRRTEIRYGQKTHQFQFKSKISCRPSKFVSAILQENSGFQPSTMAITWCSFNFCPYIMNSLWMSCLYLSLMFVFPALIAVFFLEQVLPRLSQLGLPSPALPHQEHRCIRSNRLEIVLPFNLACPSCFYNK